MCEEKEITVCHIRDIEVPDQVLSEYSDSRGLYFFPDLILKCAIGTFVLILYLVYLERLISISNANNQILAQVPGIAREIKKSNFEKKI